jgi:hypothetical protein
MTPTLSLWYAPRGRSHVTRLDCLPQAAATTTRCGPRKHHTSNSCRCQALPPAPCGQGGAGAGARAAERTHAAGAESRLARRVMWQCSKTSRAAGSRRGWGQPLELRLKRFCRLQLHRGVRDANGGRAGRPGKPPPETCNTTATTAAAAAACVTCRRWPLSPGRRGARAGARAGSRGKPATEGWCGLQGSTALPSSAPRAKQQWRGKPTHGRAPAGLGARKGRAAGAHSIAAAIECKVFA